ncbi:MAG TPA: MaoC family dehydratase [Proteobacteria bacterium]|nr:(R)-specific enoyl-CoA hydratase [bacterium BMS3Abin14]HDL53061.1 MaoC family dehydratase [Pseudomonadota bacterium]
MTEIRRKVIEGIRVGDTLTVTRTFTREDTRAFADVSLDYNPYHFHRSYTDSREFDGLICHGLLVGGMLTEIGGQLGMLASGMEFRFRGPVYFGDTITCRMTFTEIDEKGRAEAEAEYTNQDGEVVLLASLRGILPGPEEVKILKELVKRAARPGPQS